MIKSGAQIAQEAKANIKEVGVEQLADNLAKDIVVIDVREPAEYQQGHIAGAVNFPRGVLEMQIQSHPQVQGAEAPLDELNNYDIYLICRSGARSALATESLQKMGFTNVLSVAGGMVAWQEKGFHLES